MLSVLPDAVVTNIATPVTINVLANDTGTNLTITSFSNPANGSLVFNGDKTFTYTPAPGFIGDDSFAYTVRNAQGTPANAEVTISVVPSTGAIVATDDLVEVVAGNAVVIPVLANDMAASGTLQLIAASMPGHGAINVLADQTIRYVPQSGFTGIDSFTYTVVDGQGSTATATVTIKVLTKNSPPLAVADSFTIEAGQPTLLAVLANDSDPDGGPLQVVGFTMPSHGSLAFNPDKTFTYTPNAGYLGTDQFTYTIRDQQGASAAASVTLAIVEVSENPDALDDQATTEAGVPVVIDVLANDDLPEGQQITIVAVTLPYRGKLAFNADKTLTYTPNAGFVGTDDFTYTIGNAKGATAKATVTIEVTPATTADTYANGYRHRRRIVLPATTAEQTTVNDPVVLFAEEAGWLKAVADGGKVVSPDGDDLRFELGDGSKLDHEIEHYDPAAGKLLAWIRVPGWTLSTQLQLVVYYGKPAPAGSEANPEGVWQGYLARWRLPSGADATGLDRDLAADNVAAGQLLGAAASLDGTGRLTLADTSWLDGLSTLTVQALVKADASMVGGSVRILAQGGAAGTPAGITLGYQAEASNGLANVVYASVGSTEGEALAVSRGDLQTTERQLIHARWQSSDAPQLYLNGARAIPSLSQPRAGQTQSIDGPLEIGRDWVGLIDEVRITDRALPVAWLAAEARNMLTPGLSYGLGQEETAATTTIPVVAVPISAPVEAGKSVDVDVLAQAFPPAGAGQIQIVSVGQPANGSATVVGTLVRYVPTNGFIGQDQLSYAIGDGVTQSVGLITFVVTDPASQGQSELPPGENLLFNSKLAGASVAGADNWSTRYPGEGTITFSATDIDGHRKVRLAAGSSGDRAAIEQLHRVEAGKRYAFSVHCAAVDAVAEPVRVVLNHAPFSLGSIVGGPEARPKMSDMVPGQRFHYLFDATATGDLKMVLGLDGAGDITLERPMLDKVAELRGYTATSASTTTPMTDIDWEKVPNHGLYEGAIQKVASAIMSQRIQGGYLGYRMTMRRNGALAAVQVHLASNRQGETTKSRVNGSDSHGFPASWKLRFQIFNADASWQISGSALHTTDFTYTNAAGGGDEGRVLFEFNAANLNVTAGQRLLFLFSSREADPVKNHCSVNMVINGGAPAVGLNPPRAVSLFMGDDPYYVRGSSSLTPIGRGELYNLGIRYADGIEDGDVGHDASPGAHRTNIGGANRVRQRWSSPYWRRAGQIALAVYRRPNLAPQAGLTVRITGPDISAVTLTIPAGSIQQYDEEIRSSYTLTHQLFTLPTDLLLSPDTVYMVEISSPGSDGDRYRIHTMRHYRDGLANASVSSVYPAGGVKPIEPHRWSGLAEKSANGGSSWSPATWAGGGADLPLAFVINRRMAKAIEALPA